MPPPPFASSPSFLIESIASSSFAWRESSVRSFPSVPSPSASFFVMSFAFFANPSMFATIVSLFSASSFEIFCAFASVSLRAVRFSSTTSEICWNASVTDVPSNTFPLQGGLSGVPGWIDTTEPPRAERDFTTTSAFVRSPGSRSRTRSTSTPPRPSGRIAFTRPPGVP